MLIAHYKIHCREAGIPQILTPFSCLLYTSIQMRPDQPEDSRVLEWIAFASNAFNVMVPFYANVTTCLLYTSIIIIPRSTRYGKR